MENKMDCPKAHGYSYYVTRNWNNDPENLAYQRLRDISNKIIDRVFNRSVNESKTIAHNTDDN